MNRSVNWIRLFGFYDDRRRVMLSEVLESTQDDGDARQPDGSEAPQPPLMALAASVTSPRRASSTDDEVSVVHFALPPARHSGSKFL